MTANSIQDLVGSENFRLLLRKLENRLWPCLTKSHVSWHVTLSNIIKVNKRMSKCNAQFLNEMLYLWKILNFNSKTRYFWNSFKAIWKAKWKCKTKSCFEKYARSYALPFTLLFNGLYKKYAWMSSKLKVIFLQQQSSSHGFFLLKQLSSFVCIESYPHQKRRDV